MPCGYDDFPCRGKSGVAKMRACKSTAQTWAGAKAARTKYAWIVTLAGYSPTPAEEMVVHQPKPQSRQRAKKAPESAPVAAETVSSEELEPEQQPTRTAPGIVQHYCHKHSTPHIQGSEGFNGSPGRWGHRQNDSPTRWCMEEQQQEESHGN